MGCFPSKADQRDQDQLKQSKDVDDGKIVRFLLVGMGGAGKSTVLKQLQVLSSSDKQFGYFDSEWRPCRWQLDRPAVARCVRRNVVDAAIRLSEQLSLPLPPLIADLPHRIHQMNPGDDILAQRDIIECAKQLKEFFARPQVVEHLSSPELFYTGTQSFLQDERIDQIFSLDWVPTASDYIHMREATTGMHDYRFSVQGMRMVIHDLGGQVSERRQLLHNITTWLSGDSERHSNFILFVSSMAEFAQPAESNPRYTRLHESVQLFKSVLALEHVRNCGVMIFLNKQDVFRDIIRRTTSQDDRKNMAKQLPEVSPTDRDNYVTKGTRGEATYKAFEKAIAAKFAATIEKNRMSGVYHRFTCAVDTKQMSTLFGTVENEIIRDKVHRADFLFP